MERKKILVVEDEYTTRRMLSFNLKQQGYNVIEAEDGNTAYELARDEKPDLILLDIMMPGDNGFEVCKKIRATPNLVEIPIIVLTARAGPADRKFAFKAGADDYLTKPINLNDLNDRINQFIKEAEAAVPKVKPPDPGQVVTIFCPQRKMGATTLAINLTDTVSRQKDHPVVLVDLSLPKGDVALMLNFSPTRHVAELLSRPTANITLDLIKEYMHQHPNGFWVIPGPAVPAPPQQTPTVDNLVHFLDLLVEASYIVIMDLGGALTELNLTAIRHAQKVFTLTSGQPSANEALDNFLILARKLGLDITKLLPVVNQLHGPVGNNIVLVRSPIARVPFLHDKSSATTWANELAMRKLTTIVIDS